jgi:outer membrane protein insertion porin family
VLKSGEQRVELTFVLQKNVFVRKVSFEGAEVSRAGMRTSLVSLRPGGLFDPEKIPPAIEEVRAGLRKQGYFDSRVDIDVVSRPEESMVDLVFRSSSWKRYRIRSLQFDGDLVFPVRTLLSQVKSAGGDDYIPERLERDFEALAGYYRKHGYQRVEIQLAGESFEEEARLASLQIAVFPREKITIDVNGARVPSGLLSPIWEERIYEQWGLAEGEARILNHLRRKGYLFAAVESRIERLENEIRVVYDVDPGIKYRIENVTFRGLTAFSPERLKTELAVSEKALFFSLISHDRLFALPRDIELFYEENGYPDVQVVLDFVTREKSASAIFTVNEGPRQEIQSIQLEGVRFFSPEDILGELVSRQGGAFFPPDVRRDIESIEAYYLTRGIRGTTVASRVERTAGNSVILHYEINEGRKVRIRNIFISGNRVTQSRVIEKEIQVKKGGEADYSKILETRRRLEGLGIFSEVKVEEVQTDPEGEVLVVTVREGERNYIGLGFGLESRYRAGDTLSLVLRDFRPRGTAEYIRSNAFGIGAQFSLVAQYSSLERRAIASWTQPYLFGLAMPMTVLGWVEREDRESFDFDRRGLSVNAVKSLSRNRLLLVTLSLTRTETFNVEIPDPDVDIDRRLQPYSAAAVSLSMVWDRRDDTLNPEKGHFFSVVGEWAFPVFGVESDFLKSFLKYQNFRPLGSRLNLGLTARLGLGSGLRKPPERYFAGGSNSFRGEEFDQLGPVDPLTFKPIGGEAVFLINSEIRFTLIPSWKDLTLAAFFDLGNVYERFNDFNPIKLQGALGGGLRYRTPLGPVRLEIAWKLWKFDASDKRGRPLIFLTIGNVF